jgi:transposase
MREITMSIEEQRRTMVLTRVVAGSVSMAEAAALLGLSERSVWRLKRRFLADGPAGLVHGNRGRPSARRLGDADRARILELAGDRFAGANDSHLVDLLADEGLVVSRATVQRILRAAGRPSPRHRRSPRHRSRRDRMAQAGLLVQLDGSRHDWLEARGPRLTLVGAIDDATGILTGATFRDQEDVAGYLEILRDTVRRHGVPAAVYHDRHTIFVASTKTPPTLEEQLVDRRTPTQFGRALAELGITSIAAWTPQAKGRIERVWGTLQDRLVTELRLAGAADRDAANVVLRGFLPRFNRRFAVPPTDASPAWRPLAKGIRLEGICCLKYRRVVASDHTIRVGATILQLPATRGQRGYAHRRVDVEVRLDGRLIVWDGSRELLVRDAPADAVQLRALANARLDLGRTAPTVGSVQKPPRDHPWARVRPGTKLYDQIQRERLSGSQSS